ncbi:MAG: Gfo/Idh/MocA family protein [Thermomicrobiales bacterium]
MATTFRVGIIGCSGIAIAPSKRSASAVRSPQPHSHAAAYHAVPATAVVAACDVSESALERFAATWGSTACYTDYRQMLAQESLDLVSIVTPDHLHADMFVAACEAGVRGIFCEKPIATTLEDADRMVAAAERTGVKVVVNHTRRFDPFYRQATWLIEQDVIGPLRVVLGTLGGERAMLFRNGTHLIDAMAFFAGAQPAWVIAELDDLDAGYGPVYRGDGGHDPASEPGATAMIAFENGVRAVYNGSKRTVTAFEIELQGEGGRIRIGNQVAELATVSPAGGLATQPLPLQTALTSGMVVAVEELIDLIELDGDGTRALRQARTTLELLLGILASADNDGRKVAFPLVAASAVA